jgi:hypothetical protein
MGKFSTSGGFSTSRGDVHLDPRLLDIIEQAAASSGYNVEATSGVAARSTGTQNHPHGYAVDISLVDPKTGQRFDNYHGDLPNNFPVYERFAQTARVIQQQKYPELNDQFRWGGYFAAGKNPLDLMHFDVTPGAPKMAGGAWNTGAVPASLKHYGIVNHNTGLGDDRYRNQIVAQLGNAPAYTPPSGMASDAQPMVRPAAFSPPPPRSRPDFGIPARPMTEDGGKLSPQQVANLYAGILPPQPPKYGFDNAPASFGTPTVGGLSGADYTPGDFAPTSQTWDGRYATDPRMSQLGQPARPVIPPSVAPTLAQTRAEQMQMRPPVAPSLPPPPPPGMFPARPAGPPAGMPAAPPQPPQMDPISGQPISLSQFQDFLATGTPSTPPMPMARPPIPTSAPMPRPMPQQQQGGGNGSGGTYTVQPGDTLSGIASKLGTNVGTLAAANGISNPNQIMAGQRLSTGGGGQGYVPTPIARPMQAAMPPPPVPMNRPGALGGGGFLSGPPGQVNWNVADPGMGGLNGWQYGQPHPTTAVGTALSVRPPQQQGGGGGGRRFGRRHDLQQPDQIRRDPRRAQRGSSPPRVAGQPLRRSTP